MDIFLTLLWNSDIFIENRRLFGSTIDRIAD